MMTLIIVIAKATWKGLEKGLDTHLLALGRWVSTLLPLWPPGTHPEWHLQASSAATGRVATREDYRSIRVSIGEGQRPANII